MPEPHTTVPKFGASLKKSVFERQKEEAEAKRVREQAETAAVLEDFVKSFEDDGHKPNPTPTRSTPTGPGKRHFTSSGLKSGPGSLGPNLSSKSGPGSLGPAFSRKRAYDDYSNRKERGGLLPSVGDRKALSAGNEDVDTEEKAAAKPTLHLASLPPNTSPVLIKGLFAQSPLTVEHVRIVSPVTSSVGQERARKSISAIVTLAADTPGADIDAMVSRLQNKYLGCGFNLSLSRGLSSAATSSVNVSASHNTEMPFGAKNVTQQHTLSRAPPPGHRYAPPSSFTPSMPLDRHSAQVSVHIPSDLKQLKLIHRMLESLLTYGPEFEALLMSRPEVQNHEKWSWLWNARSVGGVYYRWRLWEVLTDARSRRRHGRYAPQILFEGQSIWNPPEESLRFEYVTDLEEFVDDEDYNSSDEEGDEGGIANRYNDHNAPGAPAEDVHDGLGYLNPLARSKLVHLLSRLPDTSAKLRRGDVARVTAFAIEHAGAGAEEVASLITRNVTKPLGGGHEVDKTSASQVGLYVISDILSTSASAGVRHAWRYRNLFEHALRQQKVWQTLGRAEKDYSWGKLKAEKWKRSIQSLLSLWEGWSVFPQASHAEFTDSFLNPPLTDKERATAEAEEKRRSEEEAKRNKGVNRWKSVDDESAISTDDGPGDIDGDPMVDDGDMDDISDENIDGVSMVDSSDEEIRDRNSEAVSAPPQSELPKSLGTAPETPASGRRQRPRAADMFADNFD